jgi:hypothetical protein
MSRHSPSPRSLLRPAAIGTGLAVAGVLVVYSLARVTGDPLLITNQGGEQSVPVLAAVAFTVVGALAGLGLAVLAARLARPRPTFLAVTAVGLVVSLLPPFGAAPLSTALWLNAMHLVVAAAVIPLLAGALPRARVTSGVPA